MSSGNSPGSDRREVSLCLAYLAAATGKQVTREMVEVYYDLLSDLSPDVLMQCARMAVLHHKFATIPPVATLREIAAEIQGKTTELTAMEALQGVRKLINRFGGIYATPEDRQKAKGKMPSVVAACLDAFGWDAFCSSENPEVLQAQWRKNWDQVSSRETKQATRPDLMRINGDRGPRIDTQGFGQIR